LRAKQKCRFHAKAEVSIRLTWKPRLRSLEVSLGGFTLRAGCP